MIQQQQNPNKKSYKVLSPLAKKDGSTYWMRLGTAYTNRDDSINIYLDAMPPTKDNRYHLQIRELDADELRKRESNNGREFGAARDLGGVGGGPTMPSPQSSREVTANSSGLDANGIPF